MFSLVAILGFVTLKSDLILLQIIDFSLEIMKFVRICPYITKDDFSLPFNT